MAGIVIYGSRYGTARRYAEELARRVGVEARPYDSACDIDRYDPIAYVGALYAGGVLGMKGTLSRLSSCEGRTVVVATVGLADPSDANNVSNIRANMARQLPAGLLGSAHVFHLRGGIDYSRLSLRHKTMMRLLAGKVRRLPEEERTAEVRAMLDTYGRQVDFVDLDALDPLVATLRP